MTLVGKRLKCTITRTCWNHNRHVRSAIERKLERTLSPENGLLLIQEWWFNENKNPQR